MEKDGKKLGVLIRSRRQALGMTQTALGDMLGINRQYVFSIEHGRHTFRNAALNTRIISALDLDAEEFKRLTPMKKLRTIKKARPPLGTFLARRRLELGLTQAEIARSLKRMTSTVSRMETGGYSIKPTLLAAWASILDCVIPAELIPLAQAIKPRPTKKVRSPLGTFLATRRLELGLTQVEVARPLKKTAATISQIEAGRYSPTTTLLAAWASILDCVIPAELIPPPRERKKGPNFGGFKERTTRLGAFITERRKALGLTQEQIAKHADVNRVIIARIERGTYIVNDALCEKLERALDCTIAPELRTPESQYGSIPETEGSSPPKIVIVHLTQATRDHLARLRNMLGTRDLPQVIGTACRVLDFLLAAQQAGQTILLEKDGSTETYTIDL